MSIDTGPWQCGHRNGGFPIPGLEKSSTAIVLNGPQSLHVYSKTFMAFRLAWRARIQAQHGLNLARPDRVVCKGGAIAAQAVVTPSGAPRARNPPVIARPGA